MTRKPGRRGLVLALAGAVALAAALVWLAAPGPEPPAPPPVPEPAPAPAPQEVPRPAPAPQEVPRPAPAPQEAAPEPRPWPDNATAWAVVDDAPPQAWYMWDDLARWVLERYDPAAGELRLSVAGLAERYGYGPGGEAAQGGAAAGAVGPAALKLVYWLYADDLVASLARQAETTRRVAVAEDGRVVSRRLSRAETARMFRLAASWLRRLSACRLALAGRDRAGVPDEQCRQGLAALERILGRPPGRELVSAIGELLAGLAGRFEARAEDYTGQEAGPETSQTTQ
jgi:hypothetical protein